jgi:hypothetical protein
VREAIGHHAARGHLLPVVADRGGGTQRFFQVARIELDLPGLRPSGLRGGVAPDAREAIGLQLQRDRRAVRACASIAGCALVQPEQSLHVVTELVRDHVGLCSLVPWRRGSLKNPDRVRPGLRAGGCVAACAKPQADQSVAE